eukprot:6201885-Pleurochrysis_carterae.AAC.2
MSLLLNDVKKTLRISGGQQLNFALRSRCPLAHRTRCCRLPERARLRQPPTISVRRTVADMMGQTDTGHVPRNGTTRG